MTQSGTMVDKSYGSVRWDAWSDGAVAVWGSVTTENPILVAAYDEYDRMTGLTWMTEPGRADMSGGDTAKIFWIDLSFTPKCKNAVIGE